MRSSGLPTPSITAATREWTGLIVASTAGAAPACAASRTDMNNDRAVGRAKRTLYPPVMVDSTGLPEFADVEAAAARIAPYAVETPLFENAALNAKVGGRVFLKPESLQRTGSFKFRGAYNRIGLISESERGNGVVAFSSGNHAQGVAAAAALFGI